MAIGYLLVGIACILYFLLVGVLGGLMKNLTVIRLTQLILGKHMTDENTAKLCLRIGSFVGLIGVFLFIYGGAQG